MAEEIKAGLVGGDRRMLSTASCLSERYECAVWGFSEIYGGADEEYLKNDGRHDLLFYGVAFYKKRCKVIVEEQKEK